MSHRVPFISPTSVVTAAVILVLATLFASSLSSPGTAHADHGSSLPEVSIASITPEIGEEGGYLRVTLRLSRALTADEKFCYPSQANAQPYDEMCIQGGIIVWDDYNDHLRDENTGTADSLVKFVFGEGSRDGVPQEDGSILKSWTVSISKDKCITPDRTIRIAVNTVFDDTDTYGYLIDETEHTVRVSGNDTTNGTLVDDGGDCLPVDDGETEDITVNHAPAFGSRPIIISVPENTEAGEDIGSPVTADDEDNDTLAYSLTGTDAGHFYIDSSTGQIETLGDLDHEAKATYQLFISVTDNKDIYGDPDPAQDDTIQVTINVDDVNEPPVFDANAPTALNVVENTAADVDIGDPVTATDPEQGTVTYALDDGDGASFDIDTGTGQIKTKASLMDEAQDTYTVTVTASDDNGNEAEHVVTIAVTDANDPPEFTDDNGDVQTSVTREVAENTVAGEPVGAPVAATDEENDSLTYTLGGTDAASFDIDTTTGQIKVKDALDYEGGTTTYNVTVSVHDGKDINDNADTTEDANIAVTINVTDVNEGPAFDANAPASQDVEENTAADTDIGSAYTATDPEGDTPLTYSLGGTDAASFAIDDTNGQLKTKADLDHEDKDSYSVDIQVTDGKDAEGTAEDPPLIDTTHNVIINVTDEDDAGVITFSSDTPAAGTTLTATLEDDDGVKATPAVIWAWESSTDQSTWTPVDSADADSLTLGTGDVGNYYRVTATYDDELDASKTAVGETTSAAVTAPPTNQNPEFASDAATSLGIAENTPAGENIGDPYTATHADSKGTLVYSLDATGVATFDIESSTGQLKTKAALDYESRTTSYTVTVSVSDGLDDYSNADSAEDDTIEVTINVTNIDIPAVPGQPTVTAASGAAAKLNVSWTALVGTETVPVDGYDVEYRVKDANPIAEWISTDVTISGASATITGLEYSTTYEVQVRSKNSEGESGWSIPPGEGSIPSRLDVTFSPASQSVNEGSSATITVTVSPAADRALSIPVRASSSNAESGDYSPTSTTVSFGSGDSTKTFSISTTNDSDRSDETVSLAFGTLPAAVGTGTQSTAQVTINDTTPAPVNNGGGNGGNGGGGGNNGGGGGGGGGGVVNSFTPSKTPANQVPSFIESHPTSRSVAEGTASKTDIGAPVSATDGDNDKLTYSLGGTDSASFSIDTGTGQLKTEAKLDYEIKSSYVVTVSVSDGKGGTNLIQVNIGVTDVVEVPVTNPGTEVVALVDPSGETEVQTPDGDVTVTIPEGSRPGPFFISVDSDSDDCDWDSLDDPPADELQACITVEIYDTEGNPITGDNVLDPAITIEVELDESDIGNNDLVGFVESAGAWNSVTVSESDNGQGIITVSISGISGPGTYAVGTNIVLTQTRTIIPDNQPKSSQQQSSVVKSLVPTVEPAPVPPPTDVPTPTPEATPTPEPTATPAPTATPEPTPTVAPQPTATPAPTPTVAPQPTATPAPTPTATATATPTAVPVVVDPPFSERSVLSQHMDLGAATQFSGGQASFGDIPIDYRDLRIWPLILLAVGGAMELIAIGLFVKEETDDRRNRINLRSFI